MPGKIKRVIGSPFGEVGEEVPERLTGTSPFEFPKPKPSFEPVQPAEGFIGKRSYGTPPVEEESSLSSDGIEGILMAEEPIMSSLDDAVADRRNNPVTKFFDDHIAIQNPLKDQILSQGPQDKKSKMLMLSPFMYFDDGRLGYEFVQVDRLSRVEEIQGRVKEIVELYPTEEIQSFSDQVGAKKELFNKSEALLSEMEANAPNIEPENRERFLIKYQETFDTYKGLAAEHNVLLGQLNSIHKAHLPEAEEYKRLVKELVYINDGSPVWKQGKVPEGYVRKIWEWATSLGESRAEKFAEASVQSAMADLYEINPSDLYPGMWKSFLSGFGHSSLGLRDQAFYDGEYPILHPEAAKGWNKFMQSMGFVTGATPAFSFGGAWGSATIGPGMGTLAGALAMEHGLRAYYMYVIKHGEPESIQEFFDVGKDVIWESTKGLATGLTAGRARMIGGLPLETLGFVSTASALENRMFTWEEIKDTAILLGALRGIHAPIEIVRLANKVGKFYVETGMPPGAFADAIRGGRYTEAELKEFMESDETPRPLVEKTMAEIDEMEAQQVKLEADKEAAEVAKKTDKALARENRQKALEIEEAKLNEEFTMEDYAQYTVELAEEHGVPLEEVKRMFDELLAERAGKTEADTDVEGAVEVDEAPGKKRTMKDKHNRYKAVAQAVREDVNAGPRETMKISLKHQGDLTAEEVGRIYDVIDSGKTGLTVEEMASEANIDQLVDYNKKSVGKSEPLKELIEPILDKVLKPEPITEVDEGTGSELPEGLEPDVHPLRESSKKHTKAMQKIFAKDSKTLESPESFVQFLVNEVNRFLNGEKVDIDKVRDALSKLVSNPEEVRADFDRQSDYEAWVNFASEASQWARDTDRLIKKRSGGEQLNTMIPLGEIPNIVRELLKAWEENLGIVFDIKDKTSEIFRNEDIYNATRYWVDRGGNWRYELKGEGKIIEENLKHLEEGGDSYPLHHVYDHPTLFEDVPLMSETYIRLDSERVGTGFGAFYSQENDTIVIKAGSEVYNIRHEVAHAIEFKLGTKFTGIHPNTVKRNKFAEMLKDMEKTTSNEEVRLTILDLGQESYASGTVPSNMYEAIKHIRKASKGTVDEISITEAYFDYVKESSFEGYLGDPGEMLARLASFRESMSESERNAEYPWDTLDRMIETEKFGGSLEGIKTPKGSGIKLFSGIYPSEIAKLIKGVKDRLTERYGEDKNLSTSGWLFDDGKTVKLSSESITGYYTSHPDSLLLGLSSTDMKATKRILRGKEKNSDVIEFIKHSGAIRYLRFKSSDTLNIQLHNIPTKEQMEVIREGTLGGDKISLELRGKFRSTNFRNLRKSMKEVFEEGDTVLYSGIDPTKLGKEIIAKAKGFKAAMDKARGVRKFKFKPAIKRVKDEAVLSFVDTSGNIRRDFLKDLGDEGYKIVQKMVRAIGAPARASNKLKQMGKEVYKGLSRKHGFILDDLIMAYRMIAIGKYKTTKEFAFPEGFDPVSAVIYKNLFQHIEGLSDKQAAKLIARSEAYYKWMKVPLEEMQKTGLISKAELNRLLVHDYRKLSLIADIYDVKRGKDDLGPKGRNIYESGVESLARGRDTDVFEPSSEVMAMEVFARAYGRIMHNEASRTLLDLARTDKENPFVKLKADGSIPTDWGRVYVYEGGKRKALYISPEMAREWVTSSPEMTYKLSQFIKYVSMSPLLRTMATGVNWGFAVANLPRDIMHVWFAARVFEDGKWKQLYNTTAPVYAGEMIRDQAAVVSDAIMRTGRYNDYMDEGGGMEFFALQKRLLQKGRHIRGPFDPVLNFFGYLGMTSEIMTRLAVRERVIRRKAKQQGLTMEEARKDPEITGEATFAARDYMDFGQGGGITKALDNGIPYLNATVVGTRGMLRALKDNPVVSTVKLAQLAALTTGVFIYSHKMNPKTMAALKDDINNTNNLILPIGDKFSYLDEMGQERFLFVKIPFDPSQRLFKAVFEAGAAMWLGMDIDPVKVAAHIKTLVPVDIGSLPPTLSALILYLSNVDLWRGDEVWKKTDKPFPYPKSKYEYDKDTPQAMIDFGEATGFSPERSQGAVEQLITRGTMWSYLSGMAYDKAFGDLSKSQRQQALGEILSKTPVLKRFLGSTSPYSRVAEDIEEAKTDDSLERHILNMGLDKLVDGHLYHNNVTKKKIIDYIKSHKDRDERNRLKERFKFAVKIKGLPNRSFWLSLQGIPSAERRAGVYVNEYNKSDDDRREKLREGMQTVDYAGGIISREFKREVRRLRSEELKDSRE